MREKSSKFGKRLSSVINKIKALITRQPASGLYDPGLPVSWLTSGLDDYPALHGESVLREAVVFAAVRLLSDAVAKIPFYVYSGNDKVLNHQVTTLLRLRPNPVMTPYDMFKIVETFRIVYGNAFLIPKIPPIGRMAGAPVELWPVHPKQVEIVIDDRGIFNKTVQYIIRSKDGTEFLFGPDEIVHLKAVSFDGIVGVSPLSLVRWPVEASLAGQRHVRDMFKGGISTKGIVYYTGDLSPEQILKLRERLETISSGLENVGRILPLPLGFEFKPIDISMHDAQFVQISELTARLLAAVLGVKPHHIGDLSRATHTNIEQSQIEFYTDTMQPIITLYEQELTYKLLRNSEIAAGYHIRADIDAILRSDIKTRYEAYRVGISSGFLTPNEVRLREGLQEVAGGDKLLINKAYITIGGVDNEGKDAENMGS